mgnify:CR=1 FL=1
MIDVSSNYYGGMELREYLCAERNGYAQQMSIAIQNGEEGLIESGAFDALDHIISHLDAKTPAAGATATDEE